MTLIYLTFTFSSYSFIVRSGPNISTNTEDDTEKKTKTTKTFYSVAIGHNYEKNFTLYIYMRQIDCRKTFQSHAIGTVKHGTIIKQQPKSTCNVV